MRAMILAAGLGTRLRPLSYEYPKPIVPLLGRPLCTYNMEFLAGAGVRSFVLNLHQHPKLIQQKVLGWAGKRLSVDFTIEPEILGTGGGIGNARELLQGRTFVTANGDTIVRFPFERALKFHRERKSLATLVLFPDRDRRYTPVWIRPHGRIAGFGDDAGDGKLSGFYTGFQIVEPELLSHIPRGGASCIIRQVYAPLIRDGAPIHGFLSDGYFREFGTPSDYLRGAFALLGERAEDDPSTDPPLPGVTVVPPVYVSPKANLAPGAAIGPNAVVEEGASVGEGAVVENAILWPGASLPRGEALRDAVLTRGRKVPVPAPRDGDPGVSVR